VQCCEKTRQSEVRAHCPVQGYYRVTCVQDGAMEALVTEQLNGQQLLVSANVVNHPRLSFVHASMDALLPIQPSGGARKTLKDTFKLCRAPDPSWCHAWMHEGGKAFLELFQYHQTHSPVLVHPSVATLLPVQPSALLQCKCSMTAHSAYLYVMRFEALMEICHLCAELGGR